MNKLLEVRNISKYFSPAGGGKVQVLENINFEIPAEESGSIISILAQFRSGKSTLLRIIAGLEHPDEGSVILGKNAYENDTVRIIYLPETAASFPWLSVKQNIEMALKLSSKQKKLSLDEIISLVGLTGYENYFPDNSSSGFRFRISLGRALAADPEIILADDCFRIMDAVTRNEIYELVKNVNRSTGKTIILATANITEAVLLSGRILFMRKNPGRIFHHISLKDNALKDEEYINSVRAGIEDVFKKENMLESLQLTI